MNNLHLAQNLNQKAFHQGKILNVFAAHRLPSMTLLIAGNEYVCSSSIVQYNPIILHTQPHQAQLSFYEGDMHTAKT